MNNFMKAVVVGTLPAFTAGAVVPVHAATPQDVSGDAVHASVAVDSANTGVTSPAPVYLDDDPPPPPPRPAVMGVRG